MQIKQLKYIINMRNHQHSSFKQSHCSIPLVVIDRRVMLQPEIRKRRIAHMDNSLILQLLHSPLYRSTERRMSERYSIIRFTKYLISVC